MNSYPAPTPNPRLFSKATAAILAFVTRAIGTLVLSQLPWQQLQPDR